MSGCLLNPIPNSDILQQHVGNVLVEKLDQIDNRHRAETAFKEDPNVLESLSILDRRGAVDFTITHGKEKIRVIICHSNDCQEVLIVNKRSDNLLHCERCRCAEKDSRRSKELRQKNGDKRTAFDSKTPFSCLDPDEKKTKLSNIREREKKNKRTIKKLTKEKENLKRNMTQLTLTTNYVTIDTP